MDKHFSATVYVIKRIDGVPKVLLHFHKKHSAWYGLGGHVEENEEPSDAAMREAKEEAGINVKILSGELHNFKFANELPTPLFMFDQYIDRYHRHIDHIYVGTTLDDPKMNEPFRWISADELDTMDLQDDTHYIVKKVFDWFTQTL